MIDPGHAAGLDAVGQRARNDNISDDIVLLDAVGDQTMASLVAFANTMARFFILLLPFTLLFILTHVIVPSCDADRVAGDCVRPWASGPLDVSVFASMSGDPQESRGALPVFAARNVSALRVEATHAGTHDLQG